MFNNYLKAALRNLFRQKVYFFINISGLAVGMACCILILLWVRDELSYDRYHVNANQIYRVTYKTDLPNYHTHFARCPYGWVNALPDEFPEILDLVRFSHELKIAIRHEDKKFNENRFFYADANVFEVFSFSLLQGDPQNALKNPNSIVISEDIAKKYFAGREPLGKMLTARRQQGGEAKYYTVTGVFRNIPANSHFQADFLAAYDEPREAMRDIWSYIYILLKKTSDPHLLEQKFPEFITKYTNAERAKYNSLHLQPLVDIHLFSDLDREIEPNGNIAYVLIFSVVAISILLIACINFMNLSTARSAKRALEIGIRKTVGANRSQLIVYFLTESIMHCFIALFFTILLIEFFLPSFNNLTAKAISLTEILNGRFLLAFFTLPFLVGILAGSYPAFYLSAVKPLSTLKGLTNWVHLSGISNYRKQFSLRNILVFFQFSISITLIICCVITYSQHHFLIKERLGNQKDQVIAIPNTADPVRNKYRSFKNELWGHPAIIDVSAAMEEPSKEVLDAFPFTAEGITLKEENTFIHPLPVDNNFLDFFDLNLIAGFDFPPYSGENSRETYILNETAVKMIGWNSAAEAIGKNLQLTPEYARFEGGAIVGVVKDFNFSTLRKKIKPLVLFQRPIWYFCFLIKIEPGRINAALALIENKWEEIYPQYPFEFYFVDDLFAKLYRAEQKQGTILAVFAALGILVACLGLFGLVSYTAEQRTKEIGIRKVLGASVPGIVLLLSKDFLKWIMVANIFAWPLAWYAMNTWLQNFAYRIHIGLWFFLLAGTLALLVALLTVGYQAIKAAIANPVEALRYE